MSAAFHLGIHIFQKYSFRGGPNKKGKREFEGFGSVCVWFSLLQLSVYVVVLFPVFWCDTLRCALERERER